MYEDKLHEECAVFGASLLSDEAVGITYNALLSMQHRGQEGAGIAVLTDSSIYCQKDLGLVSEVFTERMLKRMPAGRIALGHTRYSTTGNSQAKNVQPFVTEYLTGRIATAHNGNITNSRELREKLEACGLDFSATSDTEVLSKLVAYNILKSENAFEGVVKSARELKGAFSFAVMTSDGQIIAVRDPHGFRPLCLGKSALGMAVASESCALDSCGFPLMRDVRPGEAVLIEKGELTKSAMVLNCGKTGMCIFEFVYFARPDSVIDGLSVNEARYNMGRQLAREFPIEADVVAGVPDSGLEAAMGYAMESGLPFVSVFIKNRYIGRSFIYPSQSQRESAVRLKLNPLKNNIEGKRIVLIDDSIVRGTTGTRIINLLKNAGAKEVHMLLSSPPFRHTCYFGIDIGSEKNLIASRLTLSEIKENMGVDTLGFISVDGLLKACSTCAVPFCTGCFTGDYGDADTGSGEKGIFEEAPCD